MENADYTAFRAKCAAKGLKRAEIDELVAADKLDAANRAARKRANGIDHDAVAAARSIGQGLRRLRQIQAGRA
ncbi:MAG: hypothetical protein RIA09_08930 [Hoeflea sp.]|uniref:hypothetical protein n=1 Tax=Hoeflea sp. TaxID=1940281 RepID=UPI0032EC6BF9